MRLHTHLPSRVDWQVAQREIEEADKARERQVRRVLYRPSRWEGIKATLRLGLFVLAWLACWAVAIGVVYALMIGWLAL